MIQSGPHRREGNVGENGRWAAGASPVRTDGGQLVPDRRAHHPSAIGNLEAREAAILAYLFGAVSGVVVFVADRDNPFVRYHAVQSILLTIGVLVIGFAMIGVYAALGPFVPGTLATMFGWIVWSLLFLVLAGAVILWVYLMLRAYEGLRPRVPIAGDIAAAVGGD